MSLYSKIMSVFLVLALVIFTYVNIKVINSFERQLIEKVPESSVKTMFSIIESYGKKVENKELTIEQAQQETLKQIDIARLNDGTYFWIHSIENKMIMHPIKKELNGQDVSQTKDPNGNLLFVGMTNLAKKNDWGATYNYLWPKPNEKDPKEKTSYLILYKPWGWILGSGMYVEDVEKSLSGFINQIRMTLIFIFILTVIASHFIVRSIVNKINATVESLSKTVHDLQNSSHKMNAVSLGLATSVDNQVSSITESVAAMDEISATIKHNERSAEQASALSSKTKSSAENGKHTVNNMLNEMQLISKSYDEINTNVISNGENIKSIIDVISQIAKKTQIINDIVFQTKLLSFNAAVEAARAGEAGKGFAVVADEIGKLANMSGHAASEINQMLSQSQDQVRTIAENSTSNIISIVNKGRTQVTNGNDVAKQCLDELSIISDCIENQDIAFSQIANAIKEQSIGVEEVNKALKILNDDTTNSVEMSSKSKEATENLKIQTQNLRESIQDLRSLLKK